MPTRFYALSRVLDSDLPILANPDDAGLADFPYAARLHTLARTITNMSEADRMTLAARLQGYAGLAPSLSPAADAAGLLVLARYLLHKGAAIEHRLNGHITEALTHERIADGIYGADLPGWLHW